MPHSKPRKSLELQILSHVNPRMDLAPPDRKNLHNLEKGYEGERKFFHLLQNELHSKCIRLYDLLLESNQTEFQIDNLLLYQNTVIMNEVKNFEGDFFIKDDKWYAVDSRKEIRNPILQLQRSEYLLRQLLQQIGVPFQVEAYLVFVNPEFTLYRAPYDKSLIFPTQLKRYIQKLNQTPSKLTMRHTNLAEELVALHLPNSSRERLPEYHYDQLRKGIVCSKCNGFVERLTVGSLYCQKCRLQEHVDTAVIRSISEFHLLFPDKRITPTKIFNWCNKIISQKSIRRILKKNMLLVGEGRGAHYKYH
ncbi:nuclease-related domain-containing protein [Pseudogracilibacillus sp. SO30301A]|uniref:nuclease-related domain-containing protein n=1 Tax=Pseudogracilibacillus sp. SO30301A TaxID=3098291 RepID=UPI00300E2DC2